MRNEDKVLPENAATAQRREWNAPRLTRFRAGEAEVGASPAVPEGPINFGS